MVYGHATDVGYNIVLTARGSPDEDRMPLKYVWHLTMPERQALTRIAKGRGGHHRPAMGKVKRVRTRLKCDAGRGRDGRGDLSREGRLGEPWRGRWQR